MDDKRKETLTKYIGDMRAVVTHTKTALSRQREEFKDRPQVVERIAHIESELQEQLDRLEPQTQGARREPHEPGAFAGTHGEQNSPSDSPVRRLGTEADRQEMVVKWRKAAALNADELANPEKIRKATLRDNTIAAGTAQDKLNILTGGVTQRTESLRIELVAGSTLKELAEETMRGRVSDTGHGVIDISARAYRMARTPLSKPRGSDLGATGPAADRTGVYWRRDLPKRSTQPSRATWAARAASRVRTRFEGWTIANAG